MKCIVGSTKAAILYEQNKPLVVEEIQLPQYLYAGQVLVEVIVSGICGSQIGEIRGVKGPDRFLPHLLGHEAFARVLQTGPGNPCFGRRLRSTALEAR